MISKKVEPREICVFLSSTFRDMDAERTYLIKHVFPKVRAQCMARQVGITEIDLRWGITEEAAKNGATIELCLAEIDRCRDFPPFFIGFLGDRYGWIPRNEDLTAYWDAREAARNRLPNIAPQSADSESRLHPENNGARYEQRIRTAVTQGISVTELEMELGVLTDGAAERLCGHALFLLRDSTCTDQLYKLAKKKDPNIKETDFYDTAGDRLKILKDRIRKTPFLQIDGYTSIEQFGKSIEDYLLHQLDEHFPYSEVPTPLQRIQDAHSAFRIHRLRNFLPRPDVRSAIQNTITKCIENTPHNPILLSGPSGQGKSALLADLARNFLSDVHWCVIDHYVGADEKNRIQDWLERVFLIVHQEYDGKMGPVPIDHKQRMSALPLWLNSAAKVAAARNGDGKAVHFLFVLDAIDQLSMRDISDLIFISKTLGSTSVMIASAANGTRAGEHAGHFEVIEVPPLTDGSKTEMIRETLINYGKQLSPELLQKLVCSPHTGSPLYLALALEILRLDARQVTLPQLADAILAAPDAESLFLQCFLRDDDYSRPEQPNLASSFMALLAASRTGLSEIELADLLALENDPIAPDTDRPRLPQVHLSWLLTIFKPFLLDQRGGNRKPMHRLLGEAALSDFGEDKARKTIADYFLQKWLSLAAKNVKFSAGAQNLILQRVSSELVGQLWMLRDDETLAELITDPQIAICMLERNRYEFSRYWVAIAISSENSSHQAEILVRRLIEHQEKAQTDWAARTAESLCLAHAFIDADEVEWASRIYHWIVMQSKLTGGRIPATTIKDSLRGFVRCFLASVINATGSPIDEEKSNQLMQMRETALNSMDHLLTIAKHDSCIDRAEYALLLSELREKSGHLIGTTYEDEELRMKDIADAFIILEDVNCKRDGSFHSTKAKAFVMILKAELDTIIKLWNARQKLIEGIPVLDSIPDGHPEKIRVNEMVENVKRKVGEITKSCITKINKTLGLSEVAEHYMEERLLAGHPERVFLFEILHSLKTQAAVMTDEISSDETGMAGFELWEDAVSYAVKTINEVQQSFFNGDQYDLRLLNAAETISLALEAGYPIPEKNLELLIPMTDPTGMSNSGTNKLFAAEIHRRLLRQSL